MTRSKRREPGAKSRPSLFSGRRIAIGLMPSWAIARVTVAFWANPPGPGPACAFVRGVVAGHIRQRHWHYRRRCGSWSGPRISENLPKEAGHMDHPPGSYVLSVMARLGPRPWVLNGIGGRIAF